MMYFMLRSALRNRPRSSNPGPSPIKAMMVLALIITLIIFMVTAL
jgi:hypothetical protein